MMCAEKCAGICSGICLGICSGIRIGIREGDGRWSMWGGGWIDVSLMRDGDD